MHPNSRYCRTCGHDFGRLYDKPIQCDVCCGAERQAALMQPEIDRLRTQVLEYAETLAATRRESEMRADRARHAADMDRGASGAGGCVVSRLQAEALRTMTERVAVLERECAHARMHLSNAAAALGPIWIGPDDTLADGIRAKVAMLEGLINE